MKQYIPQYPILRAEDLVPRNRIELVPEKQLEKTDPALLVELHNIRRGIEYKLVVADTLENRRWINIRTGYFQMVAYKEGWKFNPELYQVEFMRISPSELEKIEADQIRIYGFEVCAEKPVKTYGELSSEERAGFVVKSKSAFRLEHDSADNLAKMVDSFFK